MAATTGSRQEFPILVSSAGRRVELVSLLREDATRLGLHPRIVATDTNPMIAPACLAADISYDVPPTSDKSFIASLADICRKEGDSLARSYYRRGTSTFGSRSCGTRGTARAFEYQQPGQLGCCPG